MDPYIEASHLWEDFHNKLIGEIERSLSSLVPERYVVRTGERSYVALVQADDEDDRRLILPDVAVASSRRSRKAPRQAKGAAKVSAVQSKPGAVLMQALVKAEYREAFLEIRQLDPDRKLVTGVEVLSPSNKRPHTKGWRLYHRKRVAYLSGYANFVEIDLLRRGQRMPMINPWPDSPYYLLATYKRQPRHCYVGPASYAAPLPPLTIPLAPPDLDISLALQPLVDAIYARSRYSRDIDYLRPPTPPLSAAEHKWLDERLHERETEE